jgi:xylulose-5-phosphate/fructose-6-phosphate phosphoketolase
VPGLGQRAATLRQSMADARQECRDHTRRYGEDPSHIRDWTWPS